MASVLAATFGHAGPASAGTEGLPPSGANAAQHPVVGLAVPWAVGLTRASGGHDPGEWPPFRLPALRLWDSRTTWRDLQPAPGRWDFRTLDAIVAKAAVHGTDDVMLVLAGTPSWAAVRATADDAPWIGPGSASPPRDLRAWYDYVSTVASRYRGRIDAYEIGNEPNLRTFWNGTPGQWAAYVATASAAIHVADPSATVVADVGLVRRARDVAATSVWAATAAVAPYVDVLSIHAYPTRRTMASMHGLLARTRELLRAVDPERRPAWVTEVNVSDGSGLSGAGQRRAVRQLTQSVWTAGYERVYWYAWTALGPPNLIPLSSENPAARALRDEMTGA